MNFNLFLLQMPQFYKTTSPEDGIKFLVGIIVLVGIFVVINIVKKKNDTKSVRRGGISIGGSIGGGGRRYSSFALHRAAASIGLSKEQTKMLDFVFKTDGVTDIQRSLNNTDVLDRHFKRAYQVIERAADTEEEAQTRLSMLFSTRNALENAGGASGGAASTKQIPSDSAAVLTIGTDSYPVKVMSSRGEYLSVANPQTALGSPIRIPRGAKATLAFFTKSSKGFSFETRVIGNSETDANVLHLLHSTQRKALSQRRFRRRQEVIPTTFNFVRMEDAGRKRPKKMVVDKRMMKGNIQDISIGGCSIKTNTPVPSGSLLKISFVYETGTSAAALGQVLRTNRSGVSTIMHIKFLRVPRKSMNLINSIVFEYGV